jgi:HMG (high mobility group) box
MAPDQPLNQFQREMQELMERFPAMTLAKIRKDIKVFEKPKQTREKTAWNIFVKQHYKRVKAADPDKKHKEIMVILGTMYKAEKDVVEDPEKVLDMEHDHPLAKKAVKKRAAVEM